MSGEHSLHDLINMISMEIFLWVSGSLLQQKRHGSEQAGSVGTCHNPTTEGAGNTHADRFRAGCPPTDRLLWGSDHLTAGSLSGQVLVLLHCEDETCVGMCVPSPN